MATSDRSGDVTATSAPLRIVHVLPHVGSAQGGPVVALAMLVAQQVDRGHHVTVAASTLERDGPPPRLHRDVRLVTEPARRAFGFRRCPTLEPRLAALASEADVLHSHLLWTDCHRMSAKVVRTAGIPHVISPCGTLDDAALRHRGFKKWPAALWFQNRALREAACLNAQSEREAESIRAHGLRNPVALIGNAIDWPGPPADGELDAFRERYGLEPGRSFVLFLGRLDPVKGLDVLVRAWAGLGEFHASWDLLVAGPDEGGHGKRIEEMVRSAGLTANVHFTGMLEVEEKWRAIAASELLVMPSDYENFGISAAEAMSAGRPVIASKGTPWRRAAEAGAGWWVDKDPQALEGALREALSLPVESRSEMGERAARLMREYTPEVIVDAWNSVYRWLLRQGEKPGCILD